MSLKAVFFDIDGTLMNENREIAASTVEAIAKLKRNGHLAFVNTGRAYSFLGDLRKGMGNVSFNGIVAGCGTYIEYGGNCLLNARLEDPVLSETLRYFDQMDVQPILEGWNHMYYYPERLDAVMEDFVNSLIESVAEHMIPIYGEESDIQVNKMTIKTPNCEIMPEIAGKLEEHYTVIIHRPDVAEVVPKAYSKVSGINFICDHLGIRLQDTYAFGDSPNDMTMLTGAGHGIAMGNGTQEVKEASEFVTTAIDEDGIRNGLRHYGLI